MSGKGKTAPPVVKAPVCITCSGLPVSVDNSTPTQKAPALRHPWLRPVAFGAGLAWASMPTLKGAGILPATAYIPVAGACGPPVLPTALRASGRNFDPRERGVAPLPPIASQSNRKLSLYRHAIGGSLTPKRVSKERLHSRECVLSCACVKHAEEPNETLDVVRTRY